MSIDPAFPYATHLDVRFKPLEKIELNALVASVKDAWYNRDGVTPGRVITLGPRDGFVVPKGVRHRTRAPDGAVILMVETASIVPTGD
jgi:hypothetical protein